MPAPRPVPITETPVEPVIRTLLVTDLVDSTRMVEKVGDARAAEVAARHDRAARDLLPRFHGLEIDKTDGFLLLFERPIDAVGYALAYHQTLSELSRELTVELHTRAGIHLGEVLLRENAPADVARGAKRLEVEGIAKPTAARVMSLARANQTLLTRGAFDLVRRSTVGTTLPSRDLTWLAHGAYRFKGVAEPMEIFEAGVAGFAPLAVPPDSEKACRVVAEGDEITLGWRPAPGQDIPLRQNWALSERLGAGGFGEVWLARHKKTGDQRVFKFCYEARRLRSLQREATLFRVLKESLGQRDDIARILDWNFDQAPYFLELEYTEGGSLIEWAEARGGLGNVPLVTRLELLAQAAEALAAAHSVGVLHKDVKPSNVLVRIDRDGVPRARLTDFGIGRVVDESVLAEQGITVLGLTEVLPGTERSSTLGTQLYMAPELLEGKTSTIQADIYALGVVLYQMVVGDVSRALAPGWRREVPDKILAHDIARMVDGSPERRPSSAQEVADRLRRLDGRRAAAAAAAARERAHRRFKLFALFGALASVVLVVVSVLAVQALNARRDADLRRGQAEDLISFMLGDLRQKLEPLGRLDILTEVGDQSLEYFASVPRADLTDEEVFRHSEALHQIGDVSIKQGNLSAAMEAFQKSLALARELAERDPDNGTWQAGLGASHYWVGHVLYRQGDLEGTLRQWRQYLAVSERLVDRDPDNQEWRLELGYAHGNLGTVQQTRGEMTAALEHFRASLEIKELLAGSDPANHEWQFELANAHNKVGWVQEARGDLKDALVHYRSDLAIKESLVATEPTHAGWRYRLAQSHHFTGYVRKAIGDLSGALEHFRTAISILDRLVAEDATNSRWQRELAVLHGQAGDVLRMEGALDLALRHAQTFLAMLDDLVDENPTDSRLQRDLGLAHNWLGSIAQARGDLDMAIDHSQSALAVLQPLIENNPQNRYAYPHLSSSYTQLGGLWAMLGRVDKAQDSWTRAVEVIEPWARDSNDKFFIVPWARPLLHLGRIEEAKPIMERLHAIGYQNPELLQLAKSKGIRPASN